MSSWYLLVPARKCRRLPRPMTWVLSRGSVTMASSTATTVTSWSVRRSGRAAKRWRYGQYRRPPNLPMCERVAPGDGIALACGITRISDCVTSPVDGWACRVACRLHKVSLKWVQHRPGLLDGFLANVGLDLAPFCNSRINGS